MCRAAPQGLEAEQMIAHSTCSHPCLPEELQAIALLEKLSNRALRLHKNDAPCYCMTLRRHRSA